MEQALGFDDMRNAVLQGRICWKVCLHCCSVSRAFMLVVRAGSASKVRLTVAARLGRAAPSLPASARRRALQRRNGKWEYDGDLPNDGLILAARKGLDLLNETPVDVDRPAGDALPSPLLT